MRESPCRFRSTYLVDMLMDCQCSNVTLQEILNRDKSALLFTYISCSSHQCNIVPMLHMTSEAHKVALVRVAKEGNGKGHFTCTAVELDIKLEANSKKVIRYACV